MRLTIENKLKQEIFVSIFQLLKNWSSHINMHFKPDKLYIQSMDKTHTCLAEIEIQCKWFSSYDCKNNSKLSLDSSHFAILMNYALKHDTIEFNFDSDVNNDKLFISFLNAKEKSGSFDHFFELNLFEVEEDVLSIPIRDYEVDFTINSKKFSDVLSELNTFGQDLNIKCNETVVELNASGDSAKLKVNIPIDDLNEYAIAEGDELNISFSLNNLCKMCCSTKLGATIDVCLSNDFPMVLKYNLGDDSKVAFYISPNITD